MNSDFLILVLYDFIVQNILSSLLLLCYNLMIMNDYEWLWIQFLSFIPHMKPYLRQKCK
jgi:hypothetical protein